MIKSRFWGESLEGLQKAKSKLIFYRRPLTPGRVISELSFGFWTALCSRPYSQSLWIPYLHRAFPTRDWDTGLLFARLEAIRKLRNRVAHHEPILNRNLDQDYTRHYGDRLLDLSSHCVVDTPHCVLRRAV